MPSSSALQLCRYPRLAGWAHQSSSRARNGRRLLCTAALHMPSSLAYTTLGALHALTATHSSSSASSATSPPAALLAAAEHFGTLAAKTEAVPIGFHIHGPSVVFAAFLALGLLYLSMPGKGTTVRLPSVEALAEQYRQGLLGLANAVSVASDGTSSTRKPAKDTKAAAPARAAEQQQPQEAEHHLLEPSGLDMFLSMTDEDEEEVPGFTVSRLKKSAQLKRH